MFFTGWHPIWNNFISKKLQLLGSSILFISCEVNKITSQTENNVLCFFIIFVIGLQHEEINLIKEKDVEWLHITLCVYHQLNVWK